MTEDEAKQKLGIKAIHRHETTTVIERDNGHASPATHLEIKMWELITGNDEN